MFLCFCGFRAVMSSFGVRGLLCFGRFLVDYFCCAWCFLCFCCVFLCVCFVFFLFFTLFCGCGFEVVG